MSLDAIKHDLNTGNLRWGQHQKNLLIWMLDKEVGTPWLSDDLDTITRYTPKQISWDSADFLGRELQKNESSTLSGSRKTLVERMMITEKRGSGDKPRTESVALTKLGRLVAEGLKQGFTIGERPAGAAKPLPNRRDRVSAIDHGLALLNKEKDRIELALTQKIDDYGSLGVEHPTGEKVKTVQDLKEYQESLKAAVETLKAERSKLNEQFNTILTDWLRNTTSSQV